MAASCIDLEARFGSRYRIILEEHAHMWPMSERPWLARIRCRHGHVGVQGGERLYAFTNRPRIGARLRALPFIGKAQGDVEVRVVFPVDHLADVLAILIPYRRRQITEADRERLRAVGAAHRFGRIAGCQSEVTASESTPRLRATRRG